MVEVEVDPKLTIDADGPIPNPPPKFNNTVALDDILLNLLLSYPGAGDATRKSAATLLLNCASCA
jgi:hypothetical protein